MPPLLDGKGELLWKTVQVQDIDSEGAVWEKDSEGNLILDSEGQPIPVMVDNQVPVYFPDLDSEMMWHDSEGNPIVPWLKTPEGLERLGEFDYSWVKPGMFPNRMPWKYPSGFHPLQEEFIRGRVILRVVDFQGNVVLEKDNDEFINTIYFLPEDTKYLEPGLYLYQLEYITDEGEDTEERQVIQDTSFFEVLKRFTVSEN